jgi:beta-glucosidase
LERQLARPLSDVVVPPQRLVAFTRADLEAGQSKTVKLSFPVSQLAVTPADIDSTARPQVQPGSYQLQLDTMTAGFTIR